MLRSAGPFAIALLLAACSGPVSHKRAGSADSRPGPSTASAQDLRADLKRAIGNGDGLRALQAATRLEARGDSLREEDIAALELFVASLPMASLPDLAETSSAYRLIALRRALVAHHVGDHGAAQEHLQAASGQESLESRVQAVREHLQPETRADPERVAVLLPMSGPHARTGEELWAALKLAHKDAGDAPASKLKLYDTKGTEPGARAAALAAVLDKSLVAIGPAGRLESRAAAEVAFAQRMPIALLAPESEGSNAENGVFRMMVSPGFEAEQSALVAVELGYRLLAVMAPRDELGQEQANAFAKAARAAGAEVVKIGGYGPDAATLERDFRDFLNLHRLTNDRLRKHLRTYGAKSWKSFSPEVGFDLLYIPDGLERGALVASYLPYFNVELRDRDDMSTGRLHRKHGGVMPRVVQLMAPSAWNRPGLAARGGEAVEGALLLSTCPGGIGTDLSALGTQFADAFQAANGRAPSGTAAAAYDAMTMVLRARKEALIRGGQRRDLKRALRHVQLRDGLCGSLRMGPTGQVEGQIEVLRVESGVPEIYGY